MKSGYFALERQIGYYLIWAFFPSGMCVLVSMAGFWIKLTASPARNRLHFATFRYKPYHMVHMIKSPLKFISYTVYDRSLRVTLGITTFLAVNTLGQTFQRGMPKVSYIKAIDVWMISCSTFVFLAIFEFAVAQVYHMLNSYRTIPGPAPIQADGTDIP